MRLIDADTKITALLYNEEREETEYVEMTVADYLDSGTEEGCPQIVSGWISIEDRLPETRHAVLVYTPHHKNIWAASMHEDGNWYIWSPSYRILLDPDWYGPITHWMPLPEAPEV